MKKFNKNVSVVFPAYNEQDNIEMCVLAAVSILQEIVVNFEIIIVNDGSTDDTIEISNQLSKRYPNIVKVINKDKNEGYGLALRDGFKKAKYELLFFSDSDRQFDIFNLSDLLGHIDKYDIVVGYRRKRMDNIKRRFLSWGYNLFMRHLFKLTVRDIDCAFKLFHKEVFDKVVIESKRYFVNTEILAKAKINGFTIKEVGVSHFPRYEGESKVGFSDIPRTIKEVFRIKKSIIRNT